MNELSRAIEQVKNDCILTGGGEVKLSDNTLVASTWETCDIDSDFDVVTIYINIGKFRYQLLETKTES